MASAASWVRVARTIDSPRAPSPRPSPLRGEGEEAPRAANEGTLMTNKTHLDRRSVIVGAAALVAGAGVARAQQPPAPKGPRVWLDLDQKELDDAYDQSVWASNQAHVSKRRVLWSESIRTRLKPDRIAYGPTEIEKVDIYKTTRRNPPIQIFLHGGAWRGGSAKDSAYPAEMFVTAGAIFIAVDFVSIDKADGNL